jgi:integrase/recombinase XerD
VVVFKWFPLERNGGFQPPDRWCKLIQNTQIRPECESDFLLIGHRGALKRNATNLILEKNGYGVGVEVTSDKLRHTLGHKLVKDVYSYNNIQQILGHDNIQTTNLYTLRLSRAKKML